MAIRLLPRQIPQSPGVYFFKLGQRILYIGKAANLRARIKSYFLKNQISLKTAALLKEANRLSWEIVGSETEALIREAQLIKRHLPKYNVLMRDDKQYFYVGFTKEKFPKIFVTHQHKDHANFIGPFTEGGALRSVLKTLRHAFPYCTCRQIHKRQCLNARIGRCLGYCCLKPLPKAQVLQDLAQRDGASRAIRKHANMRVLAKLGAEASENTRDYQTNIIAIKKILSGKNKSLLKSLEKEMKNLSEGRRYEEAGRTRDKFFALKKIFEHRALLKADMPSQRDKALREMESILKIKGVKRIEAYDIANIQGGFAYGSMAVFEEGLPKKDDYRIFKIKSVKGSNDPAMIREVLLRRFKHREWQFPQVILIDGGKPQLNAAIRSTKRLRIIALTKNKKHLGNHILINRHTPILLTQLPESLKNLILALDSEAHRFAISHYRKSHRKSLTK